MVPVNYLAVVVGAIANMALGFLWFGPLFGKAWSREMGMTDDKMSMAKTKGMGSKYALLALGALFMAWVLAHAVIFAAAYMQMKGSAAGLMTGFMSWLGFVAPVSLGGVLWEGRSWKFWMITCGYFLVALLVMGLIIGAWL